ncbi:MAG: aminoglycoside phosphotransferase family protein [Clostridia bacterium]|nr:aminoglycoside phosphotransferase family protein [Clostridia bacterium]
MQSRNTMEAIVSHFNIEGRYIDHQPVRSGLINQTFLVTIESPKGHNCRFIFQRINTNVFREPYRVMENIMRVTEHIKQQMIETDGVYARRVLSFACTKDGQPYYESPEHGFWRAYEYVENSTAYNIAPSADHFFEAGRAFGEFQLYLNDYDATTLYETIPNFHNTISRVADLKTAIKNDTAGRLKDVQAEVDFLLSRESDAGVLVRALESGRIPYRVTHNDTKINNVLFDNLTDKAICVIDLDTVMPGSSLYDFGDAIRSGACAAAEDEPDLNKVEMDLNKYRLFTKGFIKGTHSLLTNEEIELMPISVKVMAYELAVRFLTDYLNGDVYFHTDYSGQNLLRTRTQMKLVSDVEKKLPEMIGYAHEYAEMYAKRFSDYETPNQL